MHLEIERRFIASPAVLALCHAGTEIEQGYLRADGWLTARVRIAGDMGTVTVKGRRFGCCRLEHETPVPLSAARALLSGVPARMKLRKTRYAIDISGLTWEIDVFSDSNVGLILAEVEIPNADHPLALPGWVTREVTQEQQFSNSRLARFPYGLWDMAA